MDITPLYTQKRFINYCKQITGPTAMHDDLLQSCAIIIIKRGKLPDIPNEDELFRYFKTIAYQEGTNKSSYFNREHQNRIGIKIRGNNTSKWYKKKPIYLETIPTETVDHNLNTETSKNEIKAILQEINQHKPTTKLEFVQKELFSLYLKHGSIREIVAQYNFEFNQVRKIITNYKQKIKQTYEKQRINHY